MQKANQKEFRIEKILKRKDDKLYVEWKGYNSFLIIGLIKKDIVQISGYFSLLTLDSKKKVTNWISTQISPEKIFDTHFENRPCLY